MTPILSLLALCLAAPVGFVGLRVERGRAKPDPVIGEPTDGSGPGRRSSPTPTVANRTPLRTALWATSSLAVLAAPWGLPDLPILRFFVAVCSILAFMRLTETWLGKVAGVNTRRFSDYLWYFSFFGEIRPHPPAEREWGRAMGVRRLSRGVFKAVLVLGLLSLSTAFAGLWDVWVLRSVWCLCAGYLAATGGADVVSGLQMMLSGHGCAETFVVPPLARSPIDFWGRRWNLVFRNVSYRVLFQRLARRYGVAAAGAGVFLWSILAHEYLVLATLGRTEGHMTLFFGLQGAMTIFLSRIRRGQPWPTFAAVGAHWLWMMITAPVFFAPILDVFPAHQWRLW